MSRYFLLMFFFSGIFVMRVNGQMIPAGADTTIVTEYSKSDSIYVFHQLPNSKAAYLSVQSPFKVNSTFRWWKLNNVSFNPELTIPSTETAGKDTSKTSPLTTGGYRVDIRSSINLSDSASFYGWILKDTIIIKLNKDQQGNLALGDYACKYTDLNDSARSDTLKYANPITLQAFSLGNKLNYSWWSVPTSKDPIVSSDPDNNLLSHVRISPPDYDSTYYYSRVTNQFGLSAEDHVYLKSIVPHAVFDTLGCKNYVTLQGTKYLSAPFTVNFINKSSKNAVKFDWYLDNGKNLYNTKVPKQDSVVYFFAKNKTTGVEANDNASYEIKLVAKSAELCVDTFKMNLFVNTPIVENWTKLSDSAVTMPNVFTPNGKFPYFKPVLVSIKDFEITIFTRTGKKVYGYNSSKDEKLQDWEGWNGKINNDGADASAGIYYYVINIVPWDLNPSILPKKGQYKGFIYLFR